MQCKLENNYNLRVTLDSLSNFSFVSDVGLVYVRNLRVAVQRGAMTPTPRGTMYLIVSREVRLPVSMLCPCCRRYKTRPPYFILSFFFSSLLLSSRTSSFPSKTKCFSSFQENFCFLPDFSKIWTSASRLIPNGISSRN